MERENATAEYREGMLGPEQGWRKKCENEETQNGGITGDENERNGMVKGICSGDEYGCVGGSGAEGRCSGGLQN